VIHPPAAALGLDESEFRHGIVNNLQNQSQMTVFQLFWDYHADEQIPVLGGIVLKALQSMKLTGVRHHRDTGQKVRLALHLPTAGNHLL
jgi:hypothetical protein